MTLINRYDHIELRKGREVILKAQELGIAQSPLVSTPTITTSSASTTTPGKLAVIMASSAIRVPQPLMACESNASPKVQKQ